MHLDENGAGDECAVDPKLQPYIADALEVVEVKFASDAKAATTSAESYPIEFANQQFGDAEKIVGYKNLNVMLTYTDLTMYSHLNVEHDGLSSVVDLSMTPDDIRAKVLLLYPNDQQTCLVDDWLQFESACDRQGEFRPFGQKVDELQIGRKSFELYRILDDQSAEFDSYMCRVQTLTMWFIEAASYTDNMDWRFMHYMLYEKIAATSSGQTLKLAGYMSLYRYFAYPASERARVAHVLLLPPYRGTGVGTKFLLATFRDICTLERILDVTAEAPAESFVFLRDYVDCVRCAPLADFASVKLRRGFSKDLAVMAQKKLKMCKSQVRRVYEILRYYHSKTREIHDEDNDELIAFKAELKKRLELPYKRSNRDITRMRGALADGEIAVVAANAAERENVIAKAVQQTLNAYDVVIARLMRYDPNFAATS